MYYWRALRATATCAALCFETKTPNGSSSIHSSTFNLEKRQINEKNNEVPETAIIRHFVNPSHTVFLRKEGSCWYYLGMRL